MRFALFVVSFFTSTVLAAAASECPLAGKCPYYDKAIEKAGTGSGCPLANKNCPYFEQHRQDKTLVDVLTTSDGACPLAKALRSCPFYSKMTSDAPLDLDWTKTNCPLAGKCPYYDDIKNNQTKAFHCPVLSKCPHFQKPDGKHHVHHDYDPSAAPKECPFMKMEQAKKEALEAAAAEEDASSAGEDL